MNRIYSNEEIIAFHDDYVNTDGNIATFAKQRNLSYGSLQRGFKRLKLNIRPLSVTGRKFPIKSDFFSIIDTEEKAYMLGFLYADGCNHERLHKIEIALAKRDEEILVKFSEILLYGHNQVKEYASKNKHSENRVVLYLISKQLSDDLRNAGCVARKTFILKFPLLPSYLRHHFIRGYFDGDGMLVIYEKLLHSRKCYIAEFSIVSTREMLDAIAAQINDLGINTRIIKRHKNRPNNNFTLRVAGNQQIRKLCDFLYRDASIFLKRKHTTYLKLIELTPVYRAYQRKVAMLPRTVVSKSLIASTPSPCIELLPL